jgi:uncharacterized protein YkwD
VKLEDERTNVRLAFGGVPIPFSAELYYNDPNRFFRAAAVQLPDSGYGYGPDTVSFTTSGELEVNRTLLDLDAIAKGLDLSLLIDIPAELVTEQELVIEESGLSVGAIIGIVVGSVAFVAIIGVVIAIVVLKRPKEDTTGSGQAEATVEAGNSKAADRAAYEMYAKPVQASDQRCFELVNEFRREHGKPPLVLSAALSDLVRPHTRAMLRGEIPLGDDGARERAAQAGNPRSWAENVGFCQGQGAGLPQLFKQWKDSASHSKNMLGDYDSIGIAIDNRGDTWYGTQFFVRSK